MTTLLIDADIVAYQAAAVAETPVNWGDGVWTLHAQELDVIGSIEEKITSLVAGSKADAYISCLSGANLYRKEVASYYKENRVNQRKPMLLNFAKDYIREKHNGSSVERLEADDLLGILANNPDSIIWSPDKDLLTIPAQHYIDGKIVTVTEEEADYQFFYQTMVGDSTDNYKGCPTIGAKKAEAILDKDCSWEAVVKTFESKGFSEDVAKENAQLARILRFGEYDFETKKVTLWGGDVI